MIGDLFITLGLALLLTIIIEVSVVRILGFKERVFLIVVALASVITNPALNLIITLYFHFTDQLLPLFIVIILEIIIVWIEAFILYSVFKEKYAFKLLLGISLIMNTASYLIGVIIQFYFPNLL